MAYRDGTMKIDDKRDARVDEPEIDYAKRLPEVAEQLGVRMDSGLGEKALCLAVITKCGTPLTQRTGRRVAIVDEDLAYLRAYAVTAAENTLQREASRADAAELPRYDQRTLDEAAREKMVKQNAHDSLAARRRIQKKIDKRDRKDGAK